MVHRRKLRSQGSHCPTPAKPAAAGNPCASSRSAPNSYPAGTPPSVTPALKDKTGGSPLSSAAPIDGTLSTSIAEIVRSVLSSSDSLDSLISRITEEVTKAVLLELQASVNFTTECVQDLRKELDNKTAELYSARESLSQKQDDLEQYTRRNSIRIFGIGESTQECTDTLAVNLFREKLNVNIDVSAIDRSHRVGASRNGKPRPIIVKFCSYRTRSEIFTAKRRLKGTGISIREDLTSQRQQVYTKALELFGLTNVWTLDGAIVIKDRAGKKIHTRTIKELHAIVP